MSRWIDSLRLRLVLAMTAVVALGILGTVVAAPFEASKAASGVSEMLDEPYQDIALLLPCGLMMLALIWFVAGWSLSPVAAASRQAAAVSPGNLDARVSLRGLPSEVRPLVEAFNDAVARLSEAYAAERRFVADAAHELRTPLAVLTLRLERARSGVPDWAAVEDDVRCVNRLAGQLLELSERDHVARTATVATYPLVDLARIGREASAVVLPLAERDGRTIDVDLPDSLPVRGRADDLRDLLRNLICNALQHGRGTLSLSGKVEWCGDADIVHVTVSDEGPGVPPGLEAAVFERFKKADPSSPGHGLGLAIVRETARMHDGDVEILPGPGCRAILTLPLAEAEVVSTGRRRLLASRGS